MGNVHWGAVGGTCKWIMYIGGCGGYMIDTAHWGGGGVGMCIG